MQILVTVVGQPFVGCQAKEAISSFIRCFTLALTRELIVTQMGMLARILIF